MINLVKLKSQCRLAWAMLKSAPGFVAAVVATLSLTLACLFVVLSLVNSYFLKPLDVFDETRMLVVEQQTTYQDNSSSGFQSYQSIVHWLKHSQSFERAFMINAAEQVFDNLEGQPKEDVLYVGAEYFSLLNTPFVLGQGFALAENFEELDNSVVISERFWQTHFNRDPDVLGQTLHVAGGIGGSSHTIVGVVAEQFSPSYMIASGSVEVWFPTSADARFFHNEDWQSPWTNTFRNLKLIGVLKPGVNETQVREELKSQIDTIKPEWLNNGGISDIQPVTTLYREAELGNNDELSLMMLAGALGLLTIAVLNVSTLFFSRALAQHKTLALQAVLGAKRQTLFQSLFLQSLMLMVISIGVALFVSVWGIRLFKVLAQGRLPLVNSLAVDGNLVMIAIGLCLLLAYVFALITARLVNYQALNSQMQRSGKGGVSQVSGRTVKVLIASQMCVAAILVSFSMMVLGKSIETINRPLGSKTDNLYFAQLFQANNQATLAERYDNIKHYQSVLQNSPGIKRVALGQSPVTARQNANTITDMEGNSSIFFPSQWVGPDYFDLVGSNILAGRTFSEQAIRGEVNELLVSVSVAKWLQPDLEYHHIIGKNYKGLEEKVFEIVGVTDDFNHPKFHDESFGRHIWWPSQPWSYMFVIETDDNVQLTGKQVLSLLFEANSHLTLWQFRDLAQEYDNLLYMSHLTVALCGTLAVFTLLLAAIGIFGVLSYNLGLRRYEFGIRMALGAKKSRLIRLMSKEAVVPVLLGFSVAIVMVLSGYYAYKAQLSHWLLMEWKVQMTAWLITLTIALIACFRPLLILIKAKPMASLRSE
ncbi:hypothetical protein PULV_a2434 [Pseudoalteromonas ulvae UL12]|uniref:ABC transporter permease n=1 Tax=Pseudoalteromonas ulvae TaxID=107327 RepID=UPI00186BAACE|nr:ABC transporter permease [Pseudoalteromonas ulvae]MBE0364688.1 hypothetical protein [Pseudoalteromonas ulvae UL12]